MNAYQRNNISYSLWSYSMIKLVQLASCLSLISLILSTTSIQPCSSWSTPRTANFVIQTQISRRGNGMPTNDAQRKATTHGMVFEPMSEDCIVSLVTAQKEARKLGLKEVTNEVMLAGIVDRPEKAKATLSHYGSTRR